MINARSLEAVHTHTHTLNNSVVVFHIKIYKKQNDA